MQMLKYGLIGLLLAWSFGAAADEDAQRLAAYRLSMSTMNQLEQATLNVAKVVAADPSLQDEDADHETVAEIAAYHRQHPQLRKAIERAGLSTDEYALAMMSWMQASLALAVADAVPAERRAKALADSGVPRANLDFIVTNRKQLDAISQRIRAASQPR